MSATVKEGSRSRILEAAASLISQAPNQDVPLRSICQQAGVQLPTLYHYFGSKEGLISAVVSYAFDKYLGAKYEQPDLTDAVEAIRRGWDTHVEFGLRNPSLYALMYGRVHPGERPDAAKQVEQVLLSLIYKVQDQGRLRLSPECARSQILAGNVGVTLAVITDPELCEGYGPGEASQIPVSAHLRETMIQTVCKPKAVTLSKVAAGASALREALSDGPVPQLHASEQALLEHWLRELEGAEAN